MTVLLIIGKVLLKIIEILLILLLLVILTACAVLFIPVRYDFDMSLYDNTDIHGRISWFFRIANIPVSYAENKLEYRIKVFGVDYNKIKNFWVHFIKHSNNDKTLEMMEVSDIDEKEDNDEENNSNIEEKYSDRQRAEEQKSEKQRSEEHSISNNETDRTGKSSKKKKRKKLKISVSEIRKKIRNFFNTIKQLLYRTSILKEFLKSEELSCMVCFAKDNMIHLLKRIKPKRFNGDIRFGTGDPCSTGELLGVISAVWGFWGFDVNITPDFEEKVLEGSIKVKGTIRISTLLIIFIKTMISDEWKNFTGLVNNMKKSIKSGVH